MTSEIICKECGKVAEIEEYPHCRFAVCNTPYCRNSYLHAMVGDNDQFNYNFKIVAKKD